VPEECLLDEGNFSYVKAIAKALEEAANEARLEEREKAADLVEGETCSDESQCECFSCPMLSAIAKAIRESGEEKEQSV